MRDKELDTYVHEIEAPPSSPLPLKFDFPHQYEPNEWAVKAALSLQKKIPGTFQHDFTRSGKMFGVLVVETTGGPRYLAGFSGKIDDSTTIEGFVPPIFNTLEEEGLFKQGEAELNALTQRIVDKEQDPRFLSLLNEKMELSTQKSRELNGLKTKILTNKAQRNVLRTGGTLTLNEQQRLAKESMEEQRNLKAVKKKYQSALIQIEKSIQQKIAEIEGLKSLRSQGSIDLQKRLFEQYLLINFKKEKATVLSLFQDRSQPMPPAGTGECALPKLLQFAALHRFKPLCFAEFWWGNSMVGEVRKHGHYYPACRAKCEPLLDFLLHGIPKQNNPILKTVATHPISIVFEDDHLMVIEKPSGLLSVPGRSSMDSVEDRLRLMFPHFPFLKAVHRLDLGTSGLMVIAKNEVSHTELQRQFEKRKVEKKYLAILEGSLSETSGEISLPLRLNLEHRPHQMVCFEHGKKALTTYKVLSTFNNQTRILFTPTTGRTHQLRVHAAHPNGLNCPILGDELYGNKKDRLYLHASYLSFQHPTLKTKLTFDSNAPF